VRDPEGVALVDDPDAVVPADRQLSERRGLQLRELREQRPDERLVDGDVGGPDRPAQPAAMVSGVGKPAKRAESTERLRIAQREPLS